MTTPLSITVDLKHARMLREAGWPQEPTQFVWRTSREDTLDWHTQYHTLPDARTLYLLREGKAFAAPTAEELLREWMKSSNIEWRIFYPGRGDNKGKVMLYPSTDTYGYSWPDGVTIVENTLANAAAAMYCYLKKSLIPL